ncbi:sensor histidine kinase [Curvivirga sp.]|uniref:sensor histidine kinase n=1 Tax=Curvivirga sp. TaxID=2856848 RepID=UPI003B5945E9
MLSRRHKFIGFSLLLLIVVTMVTFTVSRSYFLKEMAVEARAETSIYKEIMQGWLGKFRPLPSTYAAYPEIQSVLINPSPFNVDIANRVLENWSSASGASDVYLLNANGLTIAASNWDNPVTFIGQNYSFRPYYTQAMQGRLGRFFALGVISGKRGYYLSHPVRYEHQTIGVIVVKLTVEEIEQELRARQNEIFVTDEAGVVIIASHPDWRLKTLDVLNDKAISRIETERQYSIDTLDLLPIDNVVVKPDQEFGALVTTVADRSEKRKTEFLQYALPMTAEEWNIHLLVPTEAARISAMLVSLVVSSVLTVALLIAVILLQRRDRLMQMLEFRERARLMLENKVEERTADLKRSNEELRQTQSELIQAGKMAALGQMSTALSHEFNQPLTAIRTYAENANAFMDRGMDDKASENMRRILILTERMAKLSKRLSAFARKPNDNVAVIRLRDAVDEALELLQARIERSGVELSVSVDQKLCFLGGQVRLQHVLMNLIVNAMDEIAERDKKWIKIDAARVKDKVIVTVQDSGAGVPEEIKDKIFDPFFTTKEVGKGVGLGLSISYNIVRDFGGVMRVHNETQGGACFTLELNAADEKDLEEK